MDEIMNFYIFPAPQSKDKLFGTEFDMKKDPNERSGFSDDTAYLQALTDCYKTWLMADASTKQVQFSLLTRSYKVTFMASPSGREVLVATPSQQLLQLITKRGISHNQYFESKKPTQQLDDISEEESELGEEDMKAYIQYTQDAGESGPSAVKAPQKLTMKASMLRIEGRGIQLMLNILLSCIKPSTKNLRLWAPFPFKNSVYKTPFITYLGEHLGKKSKTGTKRYCCDLIGFYGSTEMREILKLMIGKNSSGLNEVLAKTLKSSLAFNWQKEVKPVNRMKVEDGDKVYIA